MTDARLSAAHPGSRFVLWIGAAAGLWSCLLVPAELPAQGAKGKKAPEVEKIVGKVTEVKGKGKAATLTIEKEGGGSLDVAVTPKLPMTVTGKGDASCIHPKAWVSSSALVLANNELFGKSFTVHVDVKALPMHCGPDPAAADVYLISGQVIDAKPDGFTLNCGDAGQRRVAYEQGARLDITVSSSDIDLIENGTKVELEGMTRSGKFIPSKMTVALEKPLTSDDLYPGDKKGAKAKAAPAAKTAVAKKAGKKGDEADGENSGDPFGVLGGKPDVKPAKTGPDKKGPTTSDPFGVQGGKGIKTVPEKKAPAKSGDATPDPFGVGGGKPAEKK